MLSPDIPMNTLIIEIKLVRWDPNNKSAGGNLFLQGAEPIFSPSCSPIDSQLPQLTIQLCPTPILFFGGEFWQQEEGINTLSLVYTVHYDIIVPQCIPCGLPQFAGWQCSRSSCCPSVLVFHSAHRKIDRNKHRKNHGVTRWFHEFQVVPGNDPCNFRI